MSSRRGGAKAKAAANAALQAKMLPAAAAPPSHPVENMRDHRAFLARSLARNDEDLSVLVDLNRTLLKVKQNIVDACGEDLLLDLGEGLLELTPCGRDLMVALPSSNTIESVQDLKDWKTHRKPELEAKIPIYDDHKQLCVDFLLRMKLRRRLMNRFVRRLNRLAHAMDGNDVNPPMPPSYGDLRLHMDPGELENFKLHDQLRKQARERIEAYRSEHPDSFLPLITVEEGQETTTKQEDEEDGEQEAALAEEKDETKASEEAKLDGDGAESKEDAPMTKAELEDTKEGTKDAKEDKMDVDEPETKENIKSDEQGEAVDKTTGLKEKEEAVAAKMEEKVEIKDEEMKEADASEPAAPSKVAAATLDKAVEHEKEDDASSSDDMFANSDKEEPAETSDKKTEEIKEADAKAANTEEEAPKTPVKKEPTMEAKKEAAADALMAMFSSPTTAPTTPTTPLEEPANEQATSTDKGEQSESKMDSTVEPKTETAPSGKEPKIDEAPTMPSDGASAVDSAKAPEETPKEETNLDPLKAEEAPKPVDETPQVAQKDPSKEEPTTQPPKDDSAKAPETTNETINAEKMEVDDAPAKEDGKKEEAAAEGDGAKAQETAKETTSEEQLEVDDAPGEVDGKNEVAAASEVTAEIKPEGDVPEAPTSKSKEAKVEEKANADDSMEVDIDTNVAPQDEKPAEAPQPEESEAKVADEATSAQEAAKSGKEVGKEETAKDPSEATAPKPDVLPSTPVKNEANTSSETKEAKVVSTPKKQPLIDLPPLREMNQLEKDYEILKDFVDAYEKEIDPMTGEVSYTITKAEDRQEDYELLQYGAGIGATGRSLSVKEKEVEFQRWQTALLSKIPEAPTFEELGMKNCVFKLEERRKRLRQQKEEKEMQSNKKRKLSDAASPSKKSKPEGDVSPSKKSKPEGDEERKPRNVGAVERKSPKKDAEAEKEEEVVTKKVKPLSLVPLPSFHDSDLRRIRMIHGDLIDTSMLASAKRRLDEVTDKYNKAFNTSNMLNERKLQIEQHLGHMTLVYRQRAQQAQSEHERNRAVLKKRWQEEKARYDANRMKKYLPSSWRNTPVGTTITNKVCTHYPENSTAHAVSSCLADIIDGVIIKHQNNAGDDSFRPFEEPPPFDPKNVVFDPNSPQALTLLQHQQRVQLPLQKELQALNVKLAASEEERKNIWKKMAKAKQEFEACEYQRAARMGKGGRAAPVSTVQAMSYVPNRGNTMRTAQGYAPSENVNVSDYKYSTAKVRERISNDGSVAPVTAPKQDSDGYYQRPTGRGRKGMNWDPVNGVWRPADN